jgi:hypothetical protein
MNTSLLLDKLFDKARKQARTPSETPLLSRHDVQRLLSKCAGTSSQKPHDSAWLWTIGTTFFGQQQRLVVAGGVAFVLCGITFVLLLGQSNVVEPPLPVRLNMMPKATIVHSQSVHGNVVSAIAPAQKHSVIVKHKSMKIRHASLDRQKQRLSQTSVERYLATLQPFVLSDDTPGYNPEHTMSPEEKMMRSTFLSVGTNNDVIMNLSM